MATIHQLLGYDNPPNGAFTYGAKHWANLARLHDVRKRAYIIGMCSAMDNASLRELEQIIKREQQTRDRYRGANTNG